MTAFQAMSTAGAFFLVRLGQRLAEGQPLASLATLFDLAMWVMGFMIVAASMRRRP